MVEEVWVMFKDYGVLCVVEVWGDDVFDGKFIDFCCVVKVELGEMIVFFFMEWFLCEVCGVV